MVSIEKVLCGEVHFNRVKEKNWITLVAFFALGVFVLVLCSQGNLAKVIEGHSVIYMGQITGSSLLAIPIVRFFLYPLLQKKEEIEVFAPMPGICIKVLVNEGDRVERGTLLCVIESMKMSHNIHAQTSGKIVHLNVAQGVKVQMKTKLMCIKI